MDKINSLKKFESNPINSLKRQNNFFKSILGWCVAAVLLVALVVEHIKEDPVLVYDQHGRLLGKVDFSNETRSSLSLEKDIKLWVSAYLSQSADLIEIDTSIALNHMNSALRDTYLKKWLKDQRILKVKQANHIARLEYLQDNLAIQIKQDEFIAEIHCKVNFLGTEAAPLEFKFGIRGEMIPRSASQYLGIEINQIEDL